jgi:iron complex transport system ATP-binding protein
MLAAMGSILEVNNLRVARGDTTILDDVSWRVDKGEHWAILGANGSGKTSLLKALTGYLSPTSGDVALLGRRYGTCDWRDLRLQIGVVMSAFTASIPPAEPALDTVVSGKFAQLDLWHPVTHSDRAAALRLLETSGLGSLAKREWLYLSQGERQRVLIARALMARPKLLILDEPCAGLDPVARENFLQFVEDLARRATDSGSTSGSRSTSTSRKLAPRGERPPTQLSPALVLVTHHVEEIMPAFTHALLIRSGRVLAAGPREKVLTSANLSATFAASLRLNRTNNRYRLQVAHA